jgi:hypothetical protein
VRALWTAAVASRGGRPATRSGNLKMLVLSCVTTSSGRRETRTGATSVKVVNGGEVDSEGRVSSVKQFYVGEGGGRPSLVRFTSFFLSSYL